MLRFPVGTVVPVPCGVAVAVAAGMGVAVDIATDVTVAVELAVGIADVGRGVFVGVAIAIDALGTAMTGR